MSRIVGARSTAAATGRWLIIACTAFFTVVDLFATQAILPLLAAHYRVSAGMMSIAVNSTTLGMAAGGLLVAFFGRYVDRRVGIVSALVLLSIPTALLATTESLQIFGLLRIAQGLCMAVAFGLTLAYLGEASGAGDAAGAFAAYVTGNVASNLFGRLIAASTAAGFGIATNFYLFAGLNIAGALLAAISIRRIDRMEPAPKQGDSASNMAERRRSDFRNPALLASFGIGFCLLFAFIGVFTFVNFTLVRPPLALGMMSVGLVYLVFAPSIIVTPLAGRLVAHWGVRQTLWLGLGLALVSLPLLLAPFLPLVLAAMALIGVGTFLAQATTTGFVNRAANDGATASGIYLASYFGGGLVGTAVLGALFDRLGWPSAVAGVAAALALAMALGILIRPAAQRA